MGHEKDFFIWESSKTSKTIVKFRPRGDPVWRGWFQALQKCARQIRAGKPEALYGEEHYPH
jgi:hypothetical protein